MAILPSPLSWINMQRNTFGLEWTPELDESVTKNLEQFTAVEIIPENFFQKRFENFLNLLRTTQLPVSVHGVLLSIGSAEPLKTEHLRQVLRVVDGLNVTSFSEHLSMTEVAGVEFDALTPLPWTREQLALVGEKIQKVQDALDVPFLLENVANRFVIPGGDFDETGFINELVKKTGCGLLLDVTNVYTNSVNFGFDARSWLDEISLSSVHAIHLAGGHSDPDGFLMDSHDNQICEEVWELYEHVMSGRQGVMTIIERTGNLPAIELLIEELRKAENLCTPRGLRSNTGGIAVHL